MKDAHVRGLTASDFEKISSNGFGDPYNAYPHSMAWYRDRLYVGTTRACLAFRGRFMAETDPTQLGQIWPVRIPEGLSDIDLRGEIWCFDPATREWTRVYQSPMVKGLGGFDVPLSVGFRAMAVYQGENDTTPALYAPTWGTHQNPEAVMLRSLDGRTFEVVSKPGLGFPDPFKPRAVRGLLPFKGWLFSAPAVGPKRGQPNTSGVAVVLCTKNPAGGRWEIAGEPFFENPNNLTVFHMAIFNDHLYAGTLNIHQGFEVWKTRVEGNPPFRWKRVIVRGAYRGKNNQIAISLYPFKGCLYVGSAVQTGGYDRENHVGPTAAEIIRIHPDDSWDLVVGDARMTPDGLKIPISGLPTGFDNPFCGYLWCMCEHEGWLYAGTFDWLTFLRYSAFGERLPDFFKNMLRHVDIDRLVATRGGFTLWRTRDGLHWRPVTLNGFGNPYNYGVRTMVSTVHGLFVGAANPFGPEVAVKRTAGWRYEGNPRGGLEVWLGSRRDLRENRQSLPSSFSPQVSSSLEVRGSVGQEMKKDFYRFVDELYQGSGFHHYGFWTYETRHLPAACVHLMDEILAFVQIEEGRVLDLACGTGASTAYVARSLPKALVTGVHERFGGARRNQKTWPCVTFSWLFPGFLRRWQKSHDVVIFVRGLHASPAQDRVWSMAWRLLKPGGQFVGFDCFSCVPPRHLGRLPWPKRPFIQSAVDYRERLEKVGFSKIDVHEVTPLTCLRFGEYVGRTITLKQLARSVNNTLAEVLRKNLVEESSHLKGILFSGWKGRK
mgnify:CR=1 FL=1